MKYKNHLFVLLAMILLFTTCICFNSSCTPNIKTDTSDNEVEASDFNIAASKEIYFLGDEAISLSINGALPNGFSPADVSFFIEFEDESAECVISKSNTLQFNGTGKAVIKAKIGEDIYSNSITIYSVLPESQMLERFKNAFEGTTYLGLKVDLGIHPSTAHLYSIEKNDGFICINEDGKLEFTGIRASQTLVKVYFDNKLLYEGVFTLKGEVKDEILKSFVDFEIIPNLYTDISNEMLARADRIKLQYTNCQSIDEYSFLSYCKSVKELDLTGSKLFDLSFLQGIETIETLILDNCSSITNEDSNLTLQKTLSSLTSLDCLSICGSFSCFDRNSYDLLVSTVMRGDFTLRVFEGTILNQDNVIDFSETVFFSMAEYINHIEANNNQITPHEGYSHAIICLANDKTALATTEFRKIDATSVSILELYGSNKEYKTFVSSKNDLTLNLFSYSINVSGNYGCSAVSIQNGVLNLNAFRGICYLIGGNGLVFDWWGEFTSPGAGIFADNCTVNLSTSKACELYIYGGHGADGFDGYSDGSNPSDRTSRKHGAIGGGGADGIYAEAINFLSGTIFVRGGNGGKGGDGADGSNVNIFSGGYNAGSGNSGGSGGAGINCHTYTIAADCSANLFGGNGGEGGKGGKGFLAGSNGTDYTEVYNGLPYSENNFPSISYPQF